MYPHPGAGSDPPNRRTGVGIVRIGARPPVSPVNCISPGKVTLSKSTGLARLSPTRGARIGAMQWECSRMSLRINAGGTCGWSVRKNNADPVFPGSAATPLRMEDAWPSCQFSLRTIINRQITQASFCFLCIRAGDNNQWLTAASQGSFGSPPYQGFPSPVQQLLGALQPP